MSSLHTVKPLLRIRQRGGQKEREGKIRAEEEGVKGRKRGGGREMERFPYI